MNFEVLLRKTARVAVIAAAALVTAFGAEKEFKADRITVESSRSFDEVADAVKKMAADNGMMVMAEVDQGKMLSMTGLTLNARLYLIGNPNVGKQLFSRDRSVGLYVPLRVFIHSGENGKTFVSYDKPSSLLAQFNDGEIKKVAGMLDDKLKGLAAMAAK